MKLYRNISLLLAGAVLSSLAQGCAQSGSAKPEAVSAQTTESVSVQTEAVDEYGRTIIGTGLPDDLNFNGEVINCIVRDDAQMSVDFGVNELTGDVVSDAIYKRNSMVEEKLNVDINLILAPNTNTTSGEAVGDEVIKTVMAGDPAYDIAAFYQFYGGAKLATSGVMYDLTSVKYIDFTKPWWNQDFVNELTVDGKLYYMVGSMNLSVISSLIGYFFNQNKIIDYYSDYDFLYQLVYDGKWTFDKMSTLTKDVYVDLNGDSKVDKDDFFGMMMVEDDPGPLTAQFNLRLCTKDDSGNIALSFYGDRVVSAYDMLYKYFRQSTGVYFGAKGFDNVTAFADGHSLFTICSFYKCETVLRDMTDGYSVLPLPKYDEAQSGYYNAARDSSNLMGMVSNCKNPDAVGATLELMNYYSYYDVTPAYYEVAMKTKYLADSDSANMFDIILDGSIVDFGQVYSLAISGGTYQMETVYHGLLRNLMRLGKTEIASQYESNLPIYEAGLSKILSDYAALK